MNLMQQVRQGVLPTSSGVIATVGTMFSQQGDFLVPLGSKSLFERMASGSRDCSLPRTEGTTQ